MEFESLKIKTKYWGNIFCSPVLFLFFIFSTNSFAADSLSYSGRLVKADGSPVAGPVNLKIDLAYTNAPGTVLCSQDFSSVPLSNGVFHLKLDLVCPGPPSKTVTEILTAVPSTFSAALRVSDVSNNKIYAFQEIHSMPFATISETAKQLAQLGAVNGEVLKWNDTTKKWEPGTPGGGGTVTSVSGTLPISVATGSSTPVISMTEANTSTSGYLSSADWNTFNTKEGTIAGGTALQYYRGDKSWQTLNTSVIPESGVTNLYFSNARALGVPLDGFVAGPGVIVATDTLLQAFGKAQGQINLLNSASANYLIKNGTDSITGTVTVASPTGFLRLIDPPAIFTDATNMAYVDSRDDLKINKAGDTMSGVLTLDNDLKIKGGANYVTLKGHATSAAYNLFLPQTAGTNGFVLSTDGSGNTTWINPASVANGTDTVTSASIVDGSIVDADINASAAIAQTKIANLSADLAGKEPTVTNPSDTTKYYRGDKSWQALNTTAVAEGSNLYFLNSRVLGADLLGLNTGVSGPIVAGDTVLGAFGKLQYQVTDLKAQGQWDKNVNDIYYDTGNVGIGTTTPGSALDIKGTLRLSGSTSGYVGFAPAAVAGSTTYTLPASDGSAGQILKTNGVGVLSWVTDNSGAGAFSGAINSAVTTNGAGALSTSTTSATELGYVSGVTSSIQTQLNTKQSTALPSTNILVGNGSNVATAVAMSGDATLANTGAVTLKNTGTAGTYSSVTTDAQGRVTAGTNPVVVASITGTAPVTIGGTATAPVVAMAAATTAVNGYLTSTDWNTFNSKQAALSTGPTINGIDYPANAGETLKIPLAPAAATDAVNKQYVDSFGQWGVSAGNVYRTTGNVGIGSTGPTAPLFVTHTGSSSVGVFQSSDNTATVKIDGAVGAFESSLAFTKGGTANPRWKIGANTTLESGSNLGSDFQVARYDDTGTLVGPSLVVMRSTGNVGIGTSTPSEKLDVYSGAIRSLRNSGQYLYLSGGDATNQQIYLQGMSTEANKKNMYFQSFNDASGSAAGSNGFMFQTGTMASPISVMAILEGGNVGIGTTTPVAKLQVDAGDQFIKDPSDSVLRGIYFVPSDNSKRNSVAGFQTAATANDYVTLNSYYGSIRLTTGNPTAPTERVRVTNSGNVGIGTTAPGSALDVKGTLRLSGSTSGYVGFAPAAAAGATTYTLPITQGTSGQVLSTNGVATTPTLSWVSVTSGTVTSVTSANADIAVATTTTTPVLTLNSGTGANQIVKLNGSSQLPAVNGSLLTSLNPANLSGAVSVAKGGTGLTAGTSGGIPYFNTTTSMASSALLGLNGIMLGGGAGAAPTTLGTGVSGQFLKSAGASSPAWANLAIGDLKSSVAGNLFPGSSCGAAQTLVYSIVTDSFTCTNLPASATYWSAATGGINYASGNVGIGTATPTEKLHVEGNLLVDAYSAGLDYGIYFREGHTATNKYNLSILVNDFSNGGSSADSLSINAYDGVRFVTGTNDSSGERVRITPAGNVGIGTSSPDRKFQVTKANASSSIRLDGFIAGTNMTPMMGAGSDFGSLIEGADNGQVVLALRDNDNNDGFRILSGGGNFMTDSIYDTAVFTALSNGNVGIGSTTPNGQLSNTATNTGDSGTFAAPAGTGINAKSINWEASGAGYGLQVVNNSAGPTSNGLNIYTVASDSASNILMARSNGLPRFLVRADGNVGIGNVNPVAALDISSTGGETIVLRDNDNLVTDVAYASYIRAKDSAGTNAWYIGDGSSGASGLWLLNYQANPIHFGTGGSTRMTVDADGDVGIGTTSPRSLLDLGSASSGRGISWHTDSTNSYGNIWQSLNGARTTIANGLKGSTTVNNGFESSTSALWGRTAIEQDYGLIKFYTDAATTTAYGTAMTPTERMRISNTGSVGIGTTTPASTLDVNGNVGTGPRITSFVDGANNAYWLAKGSSAEANRIGFGINADPVTGVVGSVAMRTNGLSRLTIDNAGRVGLGTESPGSILHLANGAPYITYEETDTTQKIFTGVDGSGYWIRQGTTGNPDLMTVRPTGNVGIGTSAPSYTLHVVGTAGLSTGTAWTNASDIRLKDIHGDYEYGLNEVLKLHTVRYNYKKNNPLGLPSDFSKTGFIAQEVQKVIPDAVKKREDGYLEINVDPIHWAVVNSIKDLYSKYILPLWESDKKHERAIASLKESNENLKKEKDREIASLKKEKDQEIAELKARLERIEKALKVK